MNNPYQNHQPPPPGSGGNTVLVIVAIIGGIFFIIIAGCGLIGYLAMRTTVNVAEGVTEQMNEIKEGIKEEIENTRLDAADAYVREFASNDKVVEKIGKISSHSLQKTRSSFSSTPLRIDVQGEKGKGILIVNSPTRTPSSAHSGVYLEIEGKRIALHKKVDERAAWMSASRIATINRVTLLVETIKFGPIDSSNRTGLEGIADNKSYLQIRIRMQNAGPNVNFLGWDNKQFGVSLLDALGKSIQLTDSKLTAASLAQFKPSTDLLVFEMPDGTRKEDLKTLYLRLPGQVLGGNNVAFLRIDPNSITN